MRPTVIIRLYFQHSCLGFTFNQLMSQRVTNTTIDTVVGDVVGKEFVQVVGEFQGNNFINFSST